MTWRVAIGFLVAPILPASLFPLFLALLGRTVVLPARLVVAVLLVGAYPAALLLGVPLYALLRRHLYGRGRLALFGGLVAMIPWLVIRLVAVPREAVSEGSLIQANGIPTKAGIIDMIGHLGTIFVLGAIGGMIFHAIVWAERV